MIHMPLADVEIIITLPPASLCLPTDWPVFSIPTFNIPARSAPAQAWSKMSRCEDVEGGGLAGLGDEMRPGLWGWG
jgi:hypothetical protein